VVHYGVKGDEDYRRDAGEWSFVQETCRKLSPRVNVFWLLLAILARFIPK
jgi:hypothetical protein